MRVFIVIILTMCVITGCFNLNQRIEITSEYIINENWSKEGEKAWANSISITKMKEKKDSIINPFSDLDQAEILRKLEKDTSFIRYANVKINGNIYKNKKIYFNVYNGFYWGSKLHENDDTMKTIGNLQPNCWYKFSNLVSYPYYVYVYIDSASKTHRFNVNLANY